ncbi:MAG: ATP-dependent DNA helicase RecG [Actinomycetota bacterium]|nr:ATP-dependent DNA helicase RecG [Actinomycetota bacterium]MEC9473877.1 ATP-dependent DNA helicase RecG [Actinomycetota bacterium]MED5362162.1 ATP-dependent DNA helicase RecG [Actinomycetota bacterium]MEE3255673.1 ATP-dependent DNA helicase RecG [Actinomycetota bacterium]
MTEPISLRELDAIGVDRLQGVGRQKRASLEEVQIHSVFELLTHYPRRYIDRSHEAKLADVRPGQEVMVVGDIESVSSRRTRNRKSIVEASLSDDTGTLELVFFNQAWRSKQLAQGLTVALFGKVDLYRSQLQMTNPLVDLVGDRTGRIVAIYPQSGKAGLTTWDIGRWSTEALRRCQSRRIADPIPEEYLREMGLVDRMSAFQTIHQPNSMSEVVDARDRLVLDELLRVQLVLRMRKMRRLDRASGVKHTNQGDLLTQFTEGLPFELTGAQRQTIAEISTDLTSDQPMHRLLQGDVGAGKTLVAMYAMLVAVADSHQGALMAPTEVLAEQHYLNLLELAKDLEVTDPSTLTGSRPLSIKLLTNGVTGSDRNQVLKGMDDGSVDLVIGTHALIQDGVSFSSLSVVVVDEQHRFGVEQRSVLRERGRGDGRWPHLLVMTATPIPRTAAMTVYGDLDVSTLNELPPGRSPIATSWVSQDLERVWGHVHSEVERGRQAYVVCPLIEESDKLDASSAEETRRELAEGVLSELRVGLLHGRLGSLEKQETMESFRDGHLDVLVATTVIEVGIDVPNATTMVILSADRFGIAQLHQLRGRVGRGSHESNCFLVTTEETSDDATARLSALEESTDGFALAERDLELRGEGTIFEQRQSGRNDLKLASLARDRIWVERARDLAAELVDEQGSLDKYGALEDEVLWFVERRDDDAENLLRG